MIEKYYNGVIEQTFNRLGNVKQNIVMVSYNNDFTISDLEAIKRYQRDDSVFFACFEYQYGSICAAYEPFLDIVCDIFRQYGHTDFNAFMEKCNVYDLHKDLLRGYFEKKYCVRTEGVLLNEVEYEQTRMCRAIAAMLKTLADEKPVLIVVNRFQMSSRSTMELIWLLLNEPSEKLGIVLGVNDSKAKQDMLTGVWDEIREVLDDQSQIYHIGSSGKMRACESSDAINRNYDYVLEKIELMYQLLDFDQAKVYLQELEYKIKFEGIFLDEYTLREFYMLYARNSILLGEMAKALESVNQALELDVVRADHCYISECTYLKGTCFMYQGKLEKAEKYAVYSQKEAKIGKNDNLLFKAQLLKIMAEMSGWYNIFFCVQDIHIDEELLEKIMQKGYWNHLAHIYIYAYDNKPEIVAKAYRSEDSLIYFSHGVALAEKIGNEQLVYDAYQKNIMIASTNGMNEIAMLYSVRTYEFLKAKQHILYGRIISAIGYNLSAMGQNDEAMKYYNHAIKVFYRLHMPEDIAEVYYNRSLNFIMQEKYAEAKNDLLVVMKAVEKLHLNSLRVCNLSKLYGLLALCYILQNDRFNCERYLLSCRQFLNYVIEKEKENKTVDVIHDYAKCDDDMFLYTFSAGMLDQLNGEYEKALEKYNKAELFLKQAEGNQYYSYRIFRRERMKLFSKMGRMERCQHEELTLKKYEQSNEQIRNSFSMELLDRIDLDSNEADRTITVDDIEAVIKQESVLRDYTTNRRQMEFISTWQKLIDVSDNDVNTMINTTVSTFQNHFSLDCALYIVYNDDKPHVLYNDTKCNISDDVIKTISKDMMEYPQGFAVSKISASFLEHQNVISYFGIDDVCSFVAVPFIKNEKLTSLLITYVKMKDNWHGSIERYMLNDSDLNIYSLLFREMEYAINRMESNKKIYEMNSKLQAAAVTDTLTGVYNRAGMYEVIGQMIDYYSKTQKKHGVGLMFIDLDNFKHYNDTFGHDVGDIVLKEMAAIFKKAAMGCGFVSRYGGDEFIMLLGADDMNTLEKIAKNIYKNINESNGFKKQIEQYLGHSISMTKEHAITCSIGIAKAEDVSCEDDINNLIRQADELLYKVKMGEKGHYAFL